MNEAGRPLRAMAGIAVSSCGRPAHSATVPAWQQPREVMERFVELLYRRKQVRAAFESCVTGAGFNDHDPARPSGRHAAIELLARSLGNPALRTEVLSVLVDGDMGMVHAAVGTGETMRRRVDLYRLASGRIVEHWSFAAEDEDPNGR